ncbi:MAG: hypothetical protein AAB866_00365 [Patescibacteria group bacterium]
MKKKISKKINLSDLATQKQLKDVSKEMHHYVGVLAEEFQDRIKPVVEMVMGLHDKIDSQNERLTDIIDNHERRIIVIEAKI